MPTVFWENRSYKPCEKMVSRFSSGNLQIFVALESTTEFFDHILHLLSVEYYHLLATASISRL